MPSTITYRFLLQIFSEAVILFCSAKSPTCSAEATISGSLPQPASQLVVRQFQQRRLQLLSITLRPPILVSSPPSRRLMEYYTTVKMSGSHHNQLAYHEVSHCSESPQCSCSECKMEAAFGCFTITHNQLAFKSALPRESEPKMGYWPDGHRCNVWNCPICYPGRSQRDGSSTAVSSQMLESFCS